MAIPPNNRNPGDSGHIADHQAISNTLTTHQSAIGAAQAGLVSHNARITEAEAAIEAFDSEVESFGNVDGGIIDSNYGGISPIDGGSA